MTSLRASRTLVAPIVLVIAFGHPLLVLLLIALAAIAGGTTGYALGRDIASLKSVPGPGVRVGAAARWRGS
jgi:membrane protein YqaA with SNARE-associated domain